MSLGGRARTLEASRAGDKRAVVHNPPSLSSVWSFRSQIDGVPVPIEQHVRLARLPRGTDLVLRGSPLDLVTFTRQAHEFAARFSYQGRGHEGLSVVLAAGERDVDVQFAAWPLSTRPWVGVAKVADLQRSGFALLPTFQAQHYTLIVGLATTATLMDLLEKLSSDIRPNPNPRRRGGH